MLALFFEKRCDSVFLGAFLDNRSKGCNLIKKSLSQCQSYRDQFRECLATLVHPMVEMRDFG